MKHSLINQESLNHKDEVLKNIYENGLHLNISQEIKKKATQQLVREKHVISSSWPQNFLLQNHGPRSSYHIIFSP